LRIPFHLLHCWCNTCTNHIAKWYDPLHIIMWRIGSLTLTLLALHRCPCHWPSHLLKPPTTWFNASKPLTCPSHLQPVHQAKPHLDLLHLVTWLHVMSHAISPFIAYGLIPCVPHINTY
jgi:NAD-dependent SIR2 family protein deacetylase